MRLREKRPEGQTGAKVDAKAWREDTPGDWETFEVKTNSFGNGETPRGQTSVAGFELLSFRLFDQKQGSPIFVTATVCGQCVAAKAASVAATERWYRRHSIELPDVMAVL